MRGIEYTALKKIIYNERAMFLKYYKYIYALVLVMAFFVLKALSDFTLQTRF